MSGRYGLTAALSTRHAEMAGIGASGPFAAIVERAALGQTKTRLTVQFRSAFESIADPVRREFVGTVACVCQYEQQY